MDPPQLREELGVVEIPPIHKEDLAQGSGQLIEVRRHESNPLGADHEGIGSFRSASTIEALADQAITAAGPDDAAVAVRLLEIGPRRTHAPGIDVQHIETYRQHRPQEV